MFSIDKFDMFIGPFSSGFVLATGLYMWELGRRKRAMICGIIGLVLSAAAVKLYW